MDASCLRSFQNWFQLPLPLYRNYVIRLDGFDLPVLKKDPQRARGQTRGIDKNQIATSSASVHHQSCTADDSMRHEAGIRSTHKIEILGRVPHIR